MPKEVRQCRGCCRISHRAYEAISALQRRPWHVALPEQHAAAGRASCLSKTVTVQFSILSFVIAVLTEGWCAANAADAASTLSRNADRTGVLLRCTLGWRLPGPI